MLIKQLMKTSLWMWFILTLGKQFISASQKTSAQNWICRIKALRQGRHWVWGLTPHRAIKEETLAINRDWVYNQAIKLFYLPL